MGVSKNSAIPKWMVKIMENPINPWIILGVLVPLFLETSISPPIFYGLVENPPHLSIPKSGVRCPPLPQTTSPTDLQPQPGRSEHWIDDGRAITDTEQPT